MANLMKKAKDSKGFPFKKKGAPDEPEKKDNAKEEKEETGPSFVKKTKEKYKP